MGIIFRYLTILFFTINAYSAFAVHSVEEGASHAIENFAKNHKIQAVYAVADHNKIVVHGAQGLGNLEQNKHLSVNDQMAIASGTKPFTAAAVLLLKDRNLIDLHTPISKYLDAKSGMWRDGKVPEWAQKVTVHHLLSHSSGLPEYVYTFKIDFSRTQNENNRDILHYVGGKPLAFTPGSKFDYNNTGYMLLGMIIEKVSGKTYADFMKQELFEPNDLKNTKIAAYQEALDMQLGKSNIGPKRYYVIPTGTENPKFVPVGSEIVVAPNADGGAMSNVEDLIKWNAALHGGKILSKNSYKKMINKYFVAKSSGGYKTHSGYGMYISKMHDGVEIYHHEGRALGIRSDNGYIAKDGVSYAIISNMMLHMPKEMEGKVDLTKQENQLDILYFRNAILEAL
jgi:D-alanyl-D-alanine carboxypeptidase